MYGVQCRWSNKPIVKRGNNNNNNKSIVLLTLKVRGVVKVVGVAVAGTDGRLWRSLPTVPGGPVRAGPGRPCLDAGSQG